MNDIETLLDPLASSPRLLKNVRRIIAGWETAGGQVKAGEWAILFEYRSDGRKGRAFRIQTAFATPKLIAFSGDARGRGSPLIRGASPSAVDQLQSEFGVRPTQADGTGDWECHLSDTTSDAYFNAFLDHAIALSGLSG